MLAMVCEVLLLGWRECPDVPPQAEPPGLEHCRIEMLRDQQLTIVGKGNEATLEKMIEMWCQQEAVLPVQLLLIV